MPSEAQLKAVAKGKDWQTLREHLIGHVDRLCDTRRMDTKNRDAASIGAEVVARNDMRNIINEFISQIDILGRERPGKKTGMR